MSRTNKERKKNLASQINNSMKQNSFLEAYSFSVSQLDSKSLLPCSQDHVENKLKNFRFSS